MPKNAEKAATPTTIIAPSKTQQYKRRITATQEKTSLEFRLLAFMVMMRGKMMKALMNSSRPKWPTEEVYEEKKAFATVGSCAKLIPKVSTASLGKVDESNYDDLRQRWTCCYVPLTVAKRV